MPRPTPVPSFRSARPPTPLLALVLAFVAAGVPLAQAADCCRVAWQFDPDGAPFSQADLEEAVRIRRPARATDAIAVGWVGSGLVEARTGARRRVIALGPARGPEAARLVAVAVVDLLRPPVETKDVAASKIELSATAAPAFARDLRLGLGAALNRGATSAGFALEPTALAALGLARLGQRGRMGLAFELGYGQGRGRVSGESFVVHLVPARLGVFAAGDRHAASASALVRPWVTSGWGGGQGVLVGGTLAAETGLPLGGPFGAVASLGVDLLANAVDFRVHGLSLLDTGRVVPWLRLGLWWRAG